MARSCISSMRRKSERSGSLGLGALTKTDINPVSVFRVFDLLSIHIKPYESKLSTALSECKAVARCATRKTETAINRIKTVGANRAPVTVTKTLGMYIPETL